MSLQVSSTFTYNANGFVLTDRRQSVSHTDGLSVSRTNRALEVKNMDQLGSGVYYWKLPVKFLGNKVSMRRVFTDCLRGSSLSQLSEGDLHSNTCPRGFSTCPTV